MLTASRQALMNALSFSSSVVERRNTIPILANVLFTRAQQGLCLRMTDLDVELQVDVAADLAMDFRPFTVPAQLLYEIVRKLPDGADCSLEADGPQLHNIRLKSGRSKFSLQVLQRSTSLHRLPMAGLPLSWSVRKLLLTPWLLSPLPFRLRKPAITSTVFTSTRRPMASILWRPMGIDLPRDTLPSRTALQRCLA